MYLKVLKLYLCSFSIILLISSCSNGSGASSVSQIQYQTRNYTGTLPTGGSTGLTGIRGINNSSNVYITGSYAVNSQNNGTLYAGPITGGGTYYVYNYPSFTGATVSGTNVYSADNGTNGNLFLTGSYVTAESGSNHNFGFLYDGPITNSNNESAFWKTLVFPQSQVPGGFAVGNTIPHSIMGGLIVGNYETTITAGNAFIYNIDTDTYESLVYPGSRYTSAYGIWSNGNQNYTIAGGYSAESNGVVSYGFVVDYNLSTHLLTNWTSYTYNNQAAAITHFEGITTDGAGGYNLAAGSNQSGTAIASFVNIKRNQSGEFGTAKWIDVSYLNSTTTTGDTVYQNYLLGVYLLPGISALNGYTAAIPANWFR